MFKLFVKSFLSEFVNIVLQGKKGDLIFKGTTVIKSTGPYGTVIDVNLGTSDRYEVTVKKIY